MTPVILKLNGILWRHSLRKSNEKMQALCVSVNIPDLFLLLPSPSRFWASGKAKDGSVAFLRTWLFRSGWGNNDEVTNQSSLTMQTGLPFSPVGKRKAQYSQFSHTHTHEVKCFRCVGQSKECPEEIKPVELLLRLKVTTSWEPERWNLLLWQQCSYLFHVSYCYSRGP